MDGVRITLVLCASVLAACSTAGAPPAAVPPAAVASADSPKAAQPAPKVTPKPVAPTPPVPTKASPAPTPAPKTAATPAPKPAPLDLKSLEQRLKDTSAIGVMTKLSLKNQVDDLVARFRAYHGGSRPPQLPDLRPAFELLLMKVLSLLQDKDAALAKDIDASRESIWSVLSDRNKFSQYIS